MPYVQRDETNQIIGQFAAPQEFAQEFLEDGCDELLALLTPRQPTNAELLASTDVWMSRVTEDTVVALISAGIVQRTDYAPIVIERINYRRSLRNQSPI